MGQEHRSFATNPLAATANLYKDLVSKSMGAYQANAKEVNANLDAEVAANKMVVFMEGTPDAPKSEPSHNLVKMLTQAQMVPFLAVDVLAHPALLGYTVSKSGRDRAPHVYVNGSFFADYEGMVAKYKSGELNKHGSADTKSPGVFGAELP